MSGFHLSLHDEARGPSDVGARLIALPRGGMQPPTHGLAHEFVPGGVKIDLIDPMAVSIVAPQSRHIPIGFLAEIAAFRAACPGPEVTKAIDVIGAAVRVHSGQQRCVIAVQVAQWQCRHLISD